ALPAAPAQLVIAAHHDPRRGGEERRPGIEQFGSPGRPVVAKRAAGATGPAERAGALTVVVVADMDDEVGPLRRRRLGDRGKRPGCGIAAILQRPPLQAAP